jgi:hypothetical protein
MDLYTLEHWTLEQHRERVAAADETVRRRAWTLQPRVAELLALNLRRLADRLDGRARTDAHERKLTVVSGSR